MRIYALLLCWLLVGWTAWAQDSVTRVSGFQDEFGNLGSFWIVTHQGQRIPLLKLKSADREGEADIALSEERLAQLEKMLARLRRSRNSLKSEGFEILDSLTSGESSLRSLHVLFHGARLKMLQVEQTPAGQVKREHQVSVDRNYSELNSALLKLKRKLATP